MAVPDDLVPDDLALGRLPEMVQLVGFVSLILGAVYGAVIPP